MTQVVDREGYIVVGEYVDEDVPGAKFHKRKGLHKLLEDAGNGLFDVVVCEFGLMFFPDKLAGAAETFRVLRPGGLWLFNVWDAIERNRIGALVHDTVAGFFPRASRTTSASSGTTYLRG